jgi:hypothetical protein
MKDGDTLNFPGLWLQVLETPGHTIESISIGVGILCHHGITNLVEMAGGLAAWDAAKLPVIGKE